MKVTIVDIIGILIIYQSLIFILSLLFNKKPKPLFTKVLITICLLIIFHFSYMLFEKYNTLNHFFLGPFFGLIYGPIYYLYTKSLILEALDYKKIGVHFIPALITLIGLVVFDNQIFDKINLIGLAVTIHFIVYLGIALRTLFKYRKLLKSTTSSFYNISLFWLEILIYIQLTIIVVMLLESYFQSFFITDILILIIYFLTLILINCFYYLGLKQVNLFKGFKEENVKITISKEYLIPEALFNSYIDKLNNYIENEKPYLEFEISLQDLSDKLSISPRNLSHIINKKYERNFYDFINHYRLELVKQNLKESNSPIKEIMYNSGFSNKATFNSIFKKNTGLTPTQFREKQKS
ncbi:helix-turn-helix domain-containing protein [uncultured Aquimarina sp.]|uniref:helix-turn-helix domain-containing protein n=1 Tax=uncultured Aquimarina sp. TaxID=575652 RepID=UPI002617F6C6|nr:helix-turn-helix domain-containing protein [uncultured Aquimarina sp.]